MFVRIPINLLNHMDLNMYQCGEEQCNPGHFFGPAVRDHFLIHYILKGKGVFKVGNQTYHLRQGQGFLICPEIVTYYEADIEEPWHYVWVGFHGSKAERYLQQANLSLEQPIFQYDKDDFIEVCFRQMIETKQMKRCREIRLLGLLYVFLSQLIEITDGEPFIDNAVNRQDFYIKSAIDFIDRNYSRKIGVAEIAADIGLDRSYLSTMFKKSLNISPQNFLIRYRIDKACELMHNAELSIGDISRSVGYEDPLAFSKMFRKIKNISPRDYRKQYYRT